MSQFINNPSPPMLQVPCTGVLVQLTIKQALNPQSVMRTCWRKCAIPYHCTLMATSVSGGHSATAQASSSCLAQAALKR